MDSYKILNLEEYEFAIIATSYLRPLDDKEKIEEELRSRHFRGPVLFDLLLCNGLSLNRYALMEFDGEKFVSSSLKILTNISDVSKRMIFDYFKQNESCIDTSVLPKAQRYLMRKGIVI
ncbi:MAG: type II toxin-antitoxin system RnlB family antitoxin [Clostridiales bacterium]|jgi:hypothetical protein|nr:type II toxin-antitoxin system RnlB family antitoxin [Clostridiales bacterium]